MEINHFVHGEFARALTNLLFNVQDKNISRRFCGFLTNARVSRVYDTFIFQSAKNLSRGFRGSMTHSFFNVQSQKNFAGFRGSVTHSFFQRNISRGVRGSMTHSVFKVQSKKTFVGVSRVYNTFIFQCAKSKKLSRGFLGSTIH